MNRREKRALRKQVRHLAVEYIRDNPHASYDQVQQYVEENLQADFGIGPATVDWEQIRKFIEEIIKLIMMLLPLFTDDD